MVKEAGIFFFIFNIILFKIETDFYHINSFMIFLPLEIPYVFFN